MEIAEAILFLGTLLLMVVGLVGITQMALLVGLVVGPPRHRHHTLAVLAYLVKVTLVVITRGM
jgi:hypothetical protein